MKTLSFHILWPGGNTTALVTEVVPRPKYAMVASRIMQSYPDIEQVGFLEEVDSDQVDLHLQMMGGEFCGNAARSAAYLWAQVHGKRAVNISVSGIDTILSVFVTDTTSELCLPPSFFVGITPFTEGMIVDLSGIRHLIVRKTHLDRTQELIQQYSNELPAVGVIATEEMRVGFFDITPFVWVRDTNSLIPETGCGSGSIAVALAQYHRDSLSGPVYRIKQPSGEIYIVTLEIGTNGLTNIRLQGIIENRGVGYIDIDNL